MFASVFNARKPTGFRFELVIHSSPSINGDSVVAQYYFHTKGECRKAATALGAKPWNF